MVDPENLQSRFLVLLAELTDSGKVEWARSKHDIGFVYCLTPKDLIVFEVRGDGSGTLIDPAGNVAGMVSKCRNISYLWLQPNPTFKDLLALLRKAPVDEDKFLEFRRRAHLTPLHALESLQE